jgi:alkyl hydroperoxide reductase subunit AhpC
VIGVSVDSIDKHEGWVGDIAETQGTALNFPLLADADRKVASLYGMIHPNASTTVTVRSAFIIDPSKKVRLILNYPASTGRDFTELLRTIDSLQLTDKVKVGTPVNWKQGEDVIISTAVSAKEAKERFPQGWKTLKPYLRVEKQPV